MRLRKLDPQLRNRIRNLATRVIGQTNDFLLEETGRLTITDRVNRMECCFEDGQLHWRPASETPTPTFLHKAETLETFYRRHRIVGFEPKEVLYQ